MSPTETRAGSRFPGGVVSVGSIWLGYRNSHIGPHPCQLVSFSLVDAPRLSSGVLSACAGASLNSDTRQFNPPLTSTPRLAGRQSEAACAIPVNNAGLWKAETGRGLVACSFSRATHDRSDSVRPQKGHAGMRRLFRAAQEER